MVKYFILYLLFINLVYSKSVQTLLKIKNTEINTEPVIGILSQSLEDDFKNMTIFKEYKSYIMKSYVLNLQQGGARIIVLLFDESEDQLIKKLEQVNGVLLPGGDGDYLQAANIIIKWILNRNIKQVYPLWGICLGYETMLNYTDPTILDKIKVEHQSLPIKFIMNPSLTKMYKGFDNQELQILQTLNITYNYHEQGVYLPKFQDNPELTSLYKVTALSQNDKGIQFIASIEGNTIPLYGTQFHPEKANSIFWKDFDINHSWQSILISRKFYDFFVKQSRFNNNSFKNQTLLQKNIIDNYPLLNSQSGLGYVYVFK